MLEQSAPEVVVDFTQPDTALQNALRCVQTGAHVVIGTTGFDLDAWPRACGHRKKTRCPPRARGWHRQIKHPRDSCQTCS